MRSSFMENTQELKSIEVHRSEENFDDGDKVKRAVIDIIQSVAIAIAMSVFLYIFILTPNEVDGVSMSPNLIDGNLLFTSKLHKWFNGQSWAEGLDLKYDRGDVVVFQKPGFSDFVKRVIALPGESIRLEDGVYYINEQPLREFYELKNFRKEDGTVLVDGGGALELAEDEYFLSGDNRDDSFDSRSLGAIKESWIKGKVVFRFWPLDQFGVVSGGEWELGSNE